VRAVDVLIVGAGLAGARCAETLRSIGYDGSIVVAGDEPHLPYERPALSKGLLLGTRTAASLAQRREDFWGDQAIEVARSARATDVDLHGRRATVGARPMRWRRLVIATGARARRLPGLPAPRGVHHLRGLDDAQALLADLRPGARLVVIGAGFVGAEVASTARELDLEVAIVEEAEVPLGRVLGPEVGMRMAARIRQRGVDLRLGTRLLGLRERNAHVRGVELSGGARLACDLVLIGVGAVPNADVVPFGSLVRAEDGGVATDACGRTQHPDVFACGDVASAWRGNLGRHARREHWTAAAGGASAVAHAIVDVERPDRSESFFWSDQFGWRLQMVGESGAHLRAEVCDERAGGFLVRYRDAEGLLRGGLAVDRPEALTALRGEIAESVPSRPGSPWKGAVRNV
jgi:3-phenylpropionate/trans-cinnamate dioxygenase ferredoxin reductase component